MPAAHRAVDHPVIRRRDIPYLAAYVTGAVLSAAGVGAASAIWRIPFLRCAMIAAVCYLAILGGRWMKRMVLGFLTATEHEDRVEAEETIHAETTVDMPWNRDTVPTLRPVTPSALPAWPDPDPSKDPDLISDRGASHHDALAEHPRPAHPDLRRAVGRAGHAPA